MTDRIQDNFKASRGVDLSTLAASQEFIVPRYEGESILNILPSIGDLFGLEGFQHPALRSDLIDPIRGKPKNVILVLIDALAYQRMASWLDQGSAPGWKRLQGGGLFAPLTSICPSTTCAAITSFWTDSAAAQHGMLGYEMWLKEFGITANMIEHKPITYRSSGGGLSLAGFDPQSFLPVDSITGLFQSGEIETHVFQHFAIIHSGLSQMFMGEAERHPIATGPDMWVSIRELLQARPASRKFIWAYWGQLDGTSHLYGPDSERALAEFESFGEAFEKNFLDKLGPESRKDTLVMVTADHGQITTDHEADRYDLRNHPDLTGMLHMLPSGENRLAYLFLKPGTKLALVDYIQNTWPGEFAIFDREDFLDAGLFGPGPLHPAARDRLGDLIIAARGDAFWWWAGKPNPLTGRHGGFSAQEMLVPFLAGWL